MARARQQAAPPLPFPEKLVLNQYLLKVLGVEDFPTLTERLREPDLEELTADNRSRFAMELEAHLPSPANNPGGLTVDQLHTYDENIIRHSQTIRFRERGHKWKYFQYLALLFTEIYLDRYFNDPEGLLLGLNAHVGEFNNGKPAQDQISDYKGEELSKLAIWSATGSGKTLLMHVNILQYRHYVEKAGRGRRPNKTILVTPRPGLSQQHLEEFGISGIEAEIFSSEGMSLFSGQSVEIIEITKLREEGKEKTISVDALMSNNLVLIDEGHRGASGEEWRKMRERIAEEGFTFEYSATFGQAVKATTWKDLETDYAKCILFDYSYKYFYGDGYGKDYKILNLSEDDDNDEDKRRLYLTACLLTFYQQLLLFNDKKIELQPFLIEKPLWIFVGGTVNVVRKKAGKDVSDVLDILLFLAEFASSQHRNRSIRLLERLMSGSTGLHNTLGQDIFANTFWHVLEHLFQPEALYQEILTRIFNAPASGQLHVELLKGGEGELALRMGENEPFGLINVGDAPKLKGLCEERPELVVTDREFSGSLFQEVNEKESTINVLIGAKKFSEGWNSWRVSTMGLMNIGRTEGSEIIQLFGRGVRLKGYDHCLKRHTEIMGIEKHEFLRSLETLNIFGIRADYMRQFQEYLAEEGLPGEEGREEIVLPVVRSFDDNGLKKLKMPRLKEGLDFKRQGPKPSFERPEEGFLPRHRIVLDWYPRIQMELSKGAADDAVEVKKQDGKLTAKHVAFLDLDTLFFEMEDFKNERAWFNLNLNRQGIKALLANPEWYTLYISLAELEFSSFTRIRRWQEIASSLLKKYCERYYTYQKAQWEAPHLEYREVEPDDGNFIDSYRFLIERSDHALITFLTQTKEAIERGDLRDASFTNLQAICFGRHLYQPLVHVGSGTIQVRPVPLNEGEATFVDDLRKWHLANPVEMDGKELYLLRNMSRGRGIGFFEKGGFYPDFLLWILNGGNQTVCFVDPKGVRNLEDGPNNPKINFYQTIKELEQNLADSTVSLESVIISVTPLEDINWKAGWSYEEFEQRHVLFQKDQKDAYIGKLFRMLQ